MVGRRNRALARGAPHERPENPGSTARRNARPGCGAGPRDQVTSGPTSPDIDASAMGVARMQQQSTPDSGAERAPGKRPPGAARFRCRGASSRIVRSLLRVDCLVDDCDRKQGDERCSACHVQPAASSNSARRSHTGRRAPPDRSARPSPNGKILPASSLTTRRNPLTGPKLALVAIAAADHRLRPSTVRLFSALMWSYHAGRPWKQSWARLSRHQGLHGTAARLARRELETHEYPGIPPAAPGHRATDRADAAVRGPRAGSLCLSQFEFTFLELATAPPGAASYLRKHVIFP